MSAQCPEDNTRAIDQSKFWEEGSLHWSEHRIGWAIAGGCAALAVIISVFSVSLHCRYAVWLEHLGRITAYFETRNYTKPRQQRQIIRILYLPPIFAIISFFSYRYFRKYTYFSLISVVYEAVTLSAFLLLIIEYVADTAVGHSAENAMARKNKQTLPFPFCCWRYRPTKPYFMYSVKWAVMQYVIVHPLVSVVGIVCESVGVLCEAAGFNVHFAKAYLEITDFISISIALYGLLLFYGLVKDELTDRRPLAKFLSIKLIVMFTFYQSFVFTALQGRVIKGTEYWTETNVANGLNALAICIEMVFFSVLMLWAYSANEYSSYKAPKEGAVRALVDSVNFADFLFEILNSLMFYLNFFMGRRVDTKPTSSTSSDQPMNFGQVFGVSATQPYTKTLPSTTVQQLSLDEHIRLEPYQQSMNSSRGGLLSQSPGPPSGGDL